MLPASGQQTPLQKRGVTADMAFQFGELDHVNLMNGGLSVGIPIGQVYPVGPELAFGLTLSYNSKVWEIEKGECDDGDSTPAQYSLLVPDRTSNAGLGWIVTAGRLIPPGFFFPSSAPSQQVPENWTYLSKDGGQHALYERLHNQLRPNHPETKYTNDGTFLRMKFYLGGGSCRHAGLDCRTIEFPNGQIHEFQKFGTEWKLVRERDLYLSSGQPVNFVDVDYTSSSWVFTDSHGRKQVVNFNTSGSTAGTVSSIQLQNFGNTPTLIGQATYTFEYVTPTIHRPGHFLPNCASLPPMSLQLPVLTGLIQPDGSSFAMEYHTAPTSQLNGGLASLRLPTDGKIAWEYGAQDYRPQPSGDHDFNPQETTWAVISRKNYLSSAGGAPVHGEWSYSYSPSDGTYLIPADQPQGKDPGIPCFSQTDIVDPQDNRSVYFFATHRGNASLKHEYGLPFTRCLPESSSGSTGPGPFLSERHYEGDIDLVRSVFVTYEKDGPLGLEPTQDNNNRLVYRKEVFEDDDARYQEATFLAQDGFGNWRTVISSGNFGLEKQIETDYPGGTLGSSWTVPSDATPWIFGLWTEKRQKQGSQTFKTQACFDGSTGFLQGTRVLAGASLQDQDVLSLMTKDAAGFATRVETWGGDNEDSLSGDACTRPSGNPVYRVDNMYSAGSLERSAWIDASTPDQQEIVTITDLEIDAATGLPKKSFDVSGLFTILTYDLLGRLTQEYHEDSAWTTYRYFFNSHSSCGGNPACVNTEVCENGESNCDRTAKLASSQMEFDGLGRLKREAKAVPFENGIVDPDRQFSYNAQGWLLTEEPWGADEPFSGNVPTTFALHDRFGRPKLVDPPGASTPPTQFKYQGERLTHRKVQVQIGGSLADAWTTEERDHHGRLIAVCEAQSSEPANDWSACPANAELTTYDYDAADRLVYVCSHRANATCTGGQEREFEYDGRGFLLREQHPEIGVSGNGEKLFTYDAMGHALTSFIGGNGGVLPVSMSMRYDRAGRLTGISQTENSITRPIKEFFYGLKNQGSDLRKGKLVMAKRHNWLDVLTPLPELLGNIDVVVTDSYMFTGKAGRPSRKKTDVRVAQAVTQSWNSFFEYDDLGQVTQVQYPAPESWPWQALAPPRAVNYTYDQGYLTQVQGGLGAVANYAFAPSISYQLGGMIGKVQFGSGALWQVDVDDDSDLPRPKEIKAVGVTNPFVSGAMEYDGAGNVKKIGTATFSYDRLSRLVSGQVLSSGIMRTQTAAYDSFGNLTNLTTNSAPQAVAASLTTNRLDDGDYDAAGNMTEISLDGMTYAYRYDGLNAQLSLQTDLVGNISRVYAYDANDDRIWAYQCPNVGSPTCPSENQTWTLRGLGGEVLRRYEGKDLYRMKWEEDYVYRSGTLLAMVQRSLDANGQDTDKLVNVIVDHLGSTRQVFDINNLSIDRFDFYPFGQEATVPVGADPIHKFTGHERDANTADGSFSKGMLDYMHARMCSPITARFLSVDPLGGTPRVPQSWNRYSYVRNDPMNLIDPTGMKDKRSDEDKSLLEDEDVLVAVDEVIQLTKLGEPDIANRQEAGVAIGTDGNGDYTAGPVVTDGKVNKVDVPITRHTTGTSVEFETSTGHKLAAMMHSHPGTGEATIDGKKVKAWGGAASRADKEDNVGVTGKPLYILNARVSLLRLLPGEKKATTILTGKDYKAYLKRANAARQAARGGN